MKNNIKNKNIGKRALLWMLVLLMSSFFIACTKIEITPSNLFPNGSDSAFILLSVNTPQATLPSSLKLTQATNESEIDAINVLIFEELEGEFFFNYAVSGIKNQGSAESIQFKIPLQTTSHKLKLILLANVNDVFENITLALGESETEIRKKLNKAFDTSGLFGKLPMYGEVSLPNGVNTSEIYTVSATMLRAIARIDVVKELKESSADFILDELFAFRVNNKIQLIPNMLSSNTPPKVADPSVPEETEVLTDVIALYSTDATSITQLYLPESDAATTSDEKLSGATTLVAGGRFGGAESPITYYRIDFNSRIDGHPFGQILRNHRYIFKIREVAASGWNTPSEAANNFAGSITIDVETWEDFSSDIYFDTDQFGISAREISLRYIKNRLKKLNIESTVTYQIQWLDEDGNPTGKAVVDLNDTISNDHFDVTKVQYSGDDENISHLVFRTRNHNHLGSIITSKLRITAQNWKLDITVNQDNSAMYSKFYMNILTVVGIGDLGVDMVASDASGLAMRKVLDAQFAPDGIIKIGGSSFTRIPNTTGYVGTSATENLTVLNRIFGVQDVIYFPYAVSISSSVADLLLKWLDENPHRMLIIGTDSNGTNKALRETEKILADGTWNFSSIATITSSYARATASADTEDFFNGPFGSISESATFSRADAIAGYNKAPASAVTPLIRAGNSGYTDYMFFGVNKKSRIVYHGDAQLFQTTQMSNNSGNISSDLDVLMANTWAWITEQVIYGNQ